MAPADDPDVFAYLDHRAFLRDLYQARKRRGPFSYRAFSRRAGLKSPNYLKLVIDGDRNLTRPMAKRFAKAVGLRGAAAEYFEGIVALSQAETLDERNARYAALQRYRRYREAHRLVLAQDTYHAKWYLPAIRELVTSKDFSPDPTWIAAHLEPPIRPAEAEAAVETLLELGMLARDAGGNLTQSAPVVSTGAEVMRNLHVANFHRTMMSHAITSLDRLPGPSRDISSVTLTLAPDGIARLKKRLAEFRQELVEMSELEDNPRQVVHVALAAFPLSRIDEGEEP